MTRCIQKWLQRIGDLFFPASEEHLIVRNLTHNELCVLNVTSYTNGVCSLLPYREKRVRALVHEAKFHGNEHAFRLLGDVLGRYLKERSYEETSIVMPIPLSGARMRTRGYNQSAEIVKRALTYVPYIELDTKSFVRIRDTKPQTTIERKERLKNIVNAFQVRNPNQIRGKHIILVDDVMTTGATLRAAKAALLEHSPAKVTCIAVAH
jgi:competence protein ComFC